MRGLSAFSSVGSIYFSAIALCHGFIASNSFYLMEYRTCGLRCRQQTMSATEQVTHTLAGKEIGGPLHPISNCILVRVQSKASETAGGVVLLEKSVDRYMTNINLLFPHIVHLYL